MNDFENLACVREFWTEVEASSALTLLAENGIEAILQGGQIRTTMNLYGSIIEGVKLMVREADLLRAQELVDAARAEAGAGTTPAWTCPSCRSTVDAGFDICWNCGAAAVDGEPGDADEAVAVSRPEAIRVEDDDEELFPADDAATASNDDLARRLMRSAILALGCLFISLYSFLLLTRIDRERLSPRGRRHYYTGMAFLSLDFLIWAMVLSVWNGSE